MEAVYTRSNKQKISYQIFDNIKAYYSKIVVARYGGPETLISVSEKIPEPARGEVRVRVLASGVAMPDIMAREGVHPETPKVPFTPGWDLVGIADKTGAGVKNIHKGQLVAAMPISGAYTEYICLPEKELVPVPEGSDPAESVSLILNYITAYQMLHYSAKVKPGKRVLIHGASGGVGTALLQLGKLLDLQMFGTCSMQNADTVRQLGGIPIDYKNQNFVDEILRITKDGVDIVFDPIGGKHLWESRKVLRYGGIVVGYGLIDSIRGNGISSHRPGRRNRLQGISRFALYIAGGLLLPGRKRLVPYSIQWLKRLKPAMFRRDLFTLFDMLKYGTIKPIIAQKLSLDQARRAHELLSKGGVIGKIVLLPGRSAEMPSLN